MDKGKKLFYGWWMVVVITIIFFTGGAAPFAIVLKQLMEQFHTGRGEVSLCQSIFMVAMGFTGIFVGWWVQRHSPKKFILWGTIVGGLTSLLLSTANSIWYFYVFYFIAGLGGGFSNPIAFFTLLSKWFNRKWGTVIGISMAGGALGSMVIQPLIGIIDQNVGWRATYLFSGSLVLALNVPLILFVLKDSPESKGLLPDGDQAGVMASPKDGKLQVQNGTESSVAVKNTGLLSYLKRPALWAMGIGFAFIAIGYNAVTTHEVSFITDMKVSGPVAAAALGVTLGVGSLSSLLSGWLADRLVSRYVTILFFLLAIVGLAILIPAHAVSQIWLAVIIYGLGVGAVGTLLPIVTRDIFGAANFSALFGFSVVLFAVGNAIGAPLAGFMFDATGSYHSVFIIVIATYTAAILGIYFAFGANPRPLVRLAILKK
jgi:sugar phosphate permease